MNESERKILELEFRLAEARLEVFNLRKALIEIQDQLARKTYPDLVKAIEAANHEFEEKRKQWQQVIPLREIK